MGIAEIFGLFILPTAIILLFLFWKRTTKAGIIARLVSGTSVTIVWNQVEALKNIIYELVHASIFSFILTILASLLTSAPKGLKPNSSQLPPNTSGKTSKIYVL